MSSWPVLTCWMFRVYLKRLCILLLLGTVFYKLLQTVWCYFRFFYILIFITILSTYFLLLVTETVVLKPSTLLVELALFLFSVLQILLHVVWSSIVKYVHTLEIYVSLVSWPIDHYILHLFVSLAVFLDLKSTLMLM